MKVRLMALLACSMVVMVVSACSAAGGTVQPSLASGSPASGTAITREQAIAVARAAAPMWVRGGVISALSGTFADLENPRAPIRVAPPPAPGRAVWRIALGLVNGPVDAAGANVIVDAGDGTVIQFWEWVS